MKAGEREIVLIHTSDVHITNENIPGKHYTGLIGLNAVLGAAEAVNADVVLLAGDTFDSHRVSEPVMQEAAALLAKAGRPVVILPGNHDPVLEECMFRRGSISGVPGVHILGVNGPEAVTFADQDLEVWGLPHIERREMMPIGKPPPRNTKWQVAMGHGHYVEPGDERWHSHRSWRFGDGDLAATEADYVALGHWDRWIKVGDETIAAYYSGSPDHARTANLIRLGPDGVKVERMELVGV